MSRKRWIKRTLAGLLALGTSSGCKQQFFMEPGDYKDALMSSLPQGLESRPHDPILASTVDRIGPGPMTVLDTNRPARFITLKECIAIALEQGNTGAINSQGNNFGFKNRTGRPVHGADGEQRVGCRARVRHRPGDRGGRTRAIALEVRHALDQQPVVAEGRSADRGAVPVVPEQSRRGQLQHDARQAAADRRRGRHHVQHRLFEVRYGRGPGQRLREPELHAAAPVHLRATVVAVVRRGGQPVIAEPPG